SAGDAYERLTAAQFGNATTATTPVHPLTMFSYWTSSIDPSFHSTSNSILVTVNTGSQTYTAHYVPYASAPSVTAPAVQNGTEGTAKTFQLGTFSDSTGGPWNVSVDWNDGTTPTTFSMTGTSASNVTITPQPHTYADNNGPN